MKKLTLRHERFVAEYLKDLNASQASIRAGYAANSADVTGSRLLGNASIKAAVQKAQAKRLEKLDISAERVLNEMARMAFSNVTCILDKEGNLLPPSEWPPDFTPAIKSVQVIKKNAKAGDGIIDDVLKVDLWPKDRVLEMLGKHLGLLKERVEHSGGIEVAWKESDEE